MAYEDVDTGTDANDGTGDDLRTAFQKINQNFDDIENDIQQTKAESDDRYAQLAGDADADFTAMPLVGGDPIVESGSNSDGDWTRWADGTQTCIANIEYDLSSLGSNNRYSKSDDGSDTQVFANTFEENPNPSASWSVEDNAAANRTSTLGNVVLANTDVSWRLHGTDTEPANVFIRLFVSGYWK